MLPVAKRHILPLCARLRRARTEAAGYTIVEVSLFLAISGLLVLVVLIGTGTTLQATRFTDSARSLSAYVQKQYDDLLNGVNTRTGSEACTAGVVSANPPTGQPAGTSTCLLLGKLVTLKQNSSTLQSYNIVGTEPANPDFNESDQQLIYDYQPTAVTNVGVDTFPIPWGATISGSKRLSDNKAVDAIALIRSPRSTNIITYVYKEPVGGYNLASLINPLLPADANNFNSTSNASNFCLQSADTFSVLAKIILAGGQGQDAIALSFNAVTGDCNGL